MDKKTIIVLASSIFVSLLLLSYSYIFLRDVPSLFSTILIISVIVFFSPIAIVKYAESSKTKTLEDTFPQFMHDIVETVRSGMTLPQAVETVSKNDYGNLTKYVKKLNAQLE